MNGVCIFVHQSSKARERRKFASITASPSRAVVSEIAPMWMTASSLRPSSHVISSEGGTKSASWRLLQVLPLAVLAEHVADRDIGAAGLVEARDDIRSDEIRPRRSPIACCLTATDSNFVARLGATLPQLRCEAQSSDRICARRHR